MNKLVSKYINIFRFLLAASACGFLGLLTLGVLEQAPVLGDIGNRAKVFTIFMVCDGVLVLLAALWSTFGNVRMQAPLTALAMLAGIGSVYQFLFDSYTKYAIMTGGALVMGIVTYLVMRRHSKLPNGWFYALVCAIAGLLIANVVFGDDLGTGARLWISLGPISFQPIEMVKLLLIPLGGLAYRNQIRSVAYCLTCLASSGTMLVLGDTGGACIIFSVFLLMTYLLFDNRKLSLGVIAAAVVLFFIALKLNGTAARRMADWTHAMTNDYSDQQRDYIIAVLLGGFRGLGLEYAHHFPSTKFYSREDGALAGVMAIYGAPMAAIAISCYAILVAQPAYNRSVYPSNYLITSQISMMVFTQVVLHFAGSLDLLPFTGVTAPMVSAGGSSALCFGMLMGLMAASLNPKIKLLEPKQPHST